MQINIYNNLKSKKIKNNLNVVPLKLNSHFTYLNLLSHFRNSHKSQTLKSLKESVVAMVPLPQNSKSWIRRRGGGVISDTLNQIDSYSSIIEESTTKDQTKKWLNIKLPSYAALTMIICGILIYALNRWGLCGVKRSRRKRTIGRLRRIIQVITVRKVPQM